MKTRWIWFAIFLSYMFPAWSEQTLSIIKPNAVREHHIGEIISHFEKEELTIAAMKMIQLSEQKASDFYTEHKERPFFPQLVKFMTSGPVVVMVLDGKDAVKKNRELMGATNPKEAKPGTIRAAFGKNVTENAVHGSDSPQNAQREIDFFFNEQEIVNPS